MTNKEILNYHLKILRINMAWLRCDGKGLCTEEEWKECIAKELATIPIIEEAPNGT